jgi:TldD protein
MSIGVRSTPLIDELQKAVEYGRTLGARYTELRVESLNRSYIEYKDGRVHNVNKQIEEGASIRVLAEGSWGFVSTGMLNSTALKTAIKDAHSLAVSAGKTRRDPIQLAEVAPIEAHVEGTFSKSPDAVDPKEKIEYAEHLWREAKLLDNRMSSLTARFRDSVGTKYLVTSEGTSLEITSGYVHLWSRLTGKEEGKLTGARYECGSIAEGWEYFDGKKPPPIVASRLVKLVQQQLDGVTPKPGSFPCVCGDEVIGVLAHEALGHLAEADLTLQSAFSGKIGQKIAPEGIYMVDDGTLPEGFGSAQYDDEGSPTTRVNIIKDGILAQLLTDREYAARTSLPVTGNARAEDYRFSPMIRMRNTFFERGDMADDELFEDIGFGYYCLSFAGGQAALNASFQVGVQEAFEIVEGEIGKPITNLSISGIATEALKEIKGVGKDKFHLGPGRCGKGQEAFVSDGGPLIRFDKGPITFGGKE